MPDNKDPRNIGVSGLKGINTIADIEDFTPLSTRDAARVSQQYRLNAPAGAYVGYAGAGNSKYDIGADLTAEDFYNLSDYRGRQQSGVLQLANGLAKGAVLAASTFLDGTVGLAVGLGTALGEWRLSGLWDNDFSRGLKAVNDWAEEAMPNYYTDDERENPFAARNIFINGNFIGDKFIKNLGFTIGAFYAGKLWTAPLKLAKAGALTAHVASGLGATLSAVNEGRIEALNNSTDWYNLQKAQLDDEYDKTLNRLNSLYSNTEVYNELLNNLSEDYRKKEADIKEKSLKMGNTDMLLNLPILLASNIIEFGRLYAKGFDTANRGLNITKTAGKYAAGYSKVGRTVAGAKTALSEGVEEVSQQIASNLSGYMYEPKDFNLSFNQAVVDTDTNEYTTNWAKDFMRSGLEGVKTAFGEDFNDTMEQFLIGSLTGALGMPTFGRANNKDSWLGKNRLVGLQGGIGGEVQNYNKNWKDAQEIADRLNERVNTDEFKNYYQSLLRHNKFQNDMNRAADEGKAKEYKDAEYGQLISDVALFSEAGKIDDLISMVNEATDTSDENLASIIKNTTSSNGFGPFVDSNKNPVTSTEEGKQEMINSLTSRRKEILDAIKDYQKVNNSIVQQFGESLTREQRQELIWLNLLSKNQLQRAENLAKESRPFLEQVLEDYQAAIANNGIVINNQSSTKEEIEEAQKNNETLNANIKTLNQFLTQTDSILAAQIANNPQLVISLLTKAGESNVEVNELKQYVQNITDIHNLVEDSQRYTKKLNEYLKQPEKLAKDQQKEVEKEKKKTEERRSKVLKDRLDSAQSFDDVRSALADSEEDDNIKRDVLNNNENPQVKNFNTLQRRLSATKTNVARVSKDYMTITDANELIDNAFRLAGSLDDISADSELFTNPKYLPDTPGETPQEKKERINKVKDVIKQALDLTLKEEVEGPSTDNIIQTGEPVEADEKTIEDNVAETVDEETVDSGVITDVREDGNVSFTADVNSYEGESNVPYTGKEEIKENNNDAPSEKPKEGKKQVWYPAVSQYDLTQMTDNGKWEQNTNEAWQAVNSYIKNKGGFTFCNDGSLYKYIRSGGKVYFGIDPSVEDKTIFMFAKVEDNYIPFGSLFVAKSKTDTFEGMSEFVATTQEAFANRENKEGLWISETTSDFADINHGRVQFNNATNSVKSAMEKEGSEVSTPRIVVIKSGTLVNADNAAMVPNASDKNGRTYIQVPNGRRGYKGGNSLISVQPIVLSEEVLQRAPTSNIIREIKSAISSIAQAAKRGDRTELTNALRLLSSNLLCAHLEFSLNTEKNLLFINRIGIDQKTGKPIKIRTTKKDGTSAFVPKVVATLETIDVSKRDVPNIDSLITKQILANHTFIRVNANKLASDTNNSYQQDLVNNELLVTRCPVLRVECVYPYVKPVSVQSVNTEPQETKTETQQETQVTPTTPTAGEQADVFAQLGLDSDDMNLDNAALGSTQEQNTRFVEQTKKKALRQLKQILPQIADECLVKIVDDLISSTGQPLNGMVNLANGLITLSRLGEKGTVYHEAYHVVSQLLLSSSERLQIYSQARELYGNLEDSVLEERLADGFRDYMNGKTDGLLNRIKLWFKKLYNLVTKRQAVVSSIPELYKSIAEGRFAYSQLNYKNEIKESLGEVTRERVQRYYNNFDNAMSTYKRADTPGAIRSIIRDLKWNYGDFFDITFLRRDLAKVVFNRPNEQQVAEFLREQDDRIRRRTMRGMFVPTIDQLAKLDEIGGYSDDFIATVSREEYKQATDC